MFQRNKISRPLRAKPSLDDPDILREFVRTLREGIYISTGEGEILDANTAFLSIVGAESIAELRGYRAEDFLVDPEQRRNELRILARDGAVREFELQIRSLDGQIRTVLDTTFVVQDPASGKTHFHGVLVDITARKLLEQQLVELSIRDPLTGCYNRRALESVAEKMEQQPDEMWACIYIDVDHFKQYNDMHGHHAGDQVLVRMSRFLMRQVRAEQSVIRVGGDEFVIVLSGDDCVHTDAIAQRFRAEGMQSAPVLFSLGWSIREPSEPLQQMLARADDHLLAVRALRGTKTRCQDRAATSRVPGAQCPVTVEKRGTRAADMVDRAPGTT
ncbi:MAG: GGDEF domain-containing protein [Gemmatimonadaceae bacterium]